LIDIGGFDLSACGGTHVSRTGAVGGVAVLASERHRGGARLTFVCGGRAIRALRGYRDAVSGSVRVLSVLPAELPAAVERLQLDARDLQKQVKQLRIDLAGHEGRRLAGNSIDVGGIRVVVESLAGRDAAGLKAVATAVTAEGQMCAVLLSRESSPAIVISCSPGVAVDARALMQRLIERFGGRGGGKPDMAQGGGFAAAPEQVATAARELIDAALRHSA
jgi:alanyl-tRNA synthetase